MPQCSMGTRLHGASPIGVHGVLMRAIVCFPILIEGITRGEMTQPMEYSKLYLIWS